MSPCDYINLGYHGLLITMVSFSKFITSQRGGQILVDTDGYLYILKHKQKTRNTYLCRSHGRKKKSGESATDPQPCPVKLFFYSESEIHLETSHNHEPKAGEPEALDTKTGIKRKAEEQPLTPTQTIYLSKSAYFVGHFETNNLTLSDNVLHRCVFVCCWFDTLKRWCQCLKYF